MQKLDTADMHPTALLPSNRAIDTAVKGPSQPETPDRPRTVGRTRRVSMLASMPYHALRPPVVHSAYGASQRVLVDVLLGGRSVCPSSPFRKVYAVYNTCGTRKRGPSATAR